LRIDHFVSSKSDHAGDWTCEFMVRWQQNSWRDGGRTHGEVAAGIMVRWRSTRPDGRIHGEVTENESSSKRASGRCSTQQIILCYKTDLDLSCWRGRRLHHVPSVFGRNLQCQPVRKVNTREECHWSHACKSFKRTCVGSNGILECAFLPKNANRSGALRAPR